MEIINGFVFVLFIYYDFKGKKADEENKWARAATTNQAHRVDPSTWVVVCFDECANMLI